MKKVDIYSIKGATKEDNKIIISTHSKQIDMNIDEYGRIYNEGGQYIADGEFVEVGEGIGCVTHGGKRDGAGRPSTGRKKHQYYVTDYEDEEIKKLIKKLRSSHL